QVRLLRDASGDPLCNRPGQIGGTACEYEATAIPYAFGALPFKPLGDVLGQVSHGLWGAVVVEPAGSGFHDPATGERVATDQEVRLGTHALVCLDDVPNGLCPAGRYFREHVLFYQDGLNLHWNSPWRNGASTPVADCLVCDDSYDRGEKGLNYR